MRFEIEVIHILLVDDDPQFRRVMRLALSARGYSVREAADGTGALDSLCTDLPDLVVLDWHMQPLDGPKTCRALRMKSDVPVIMVSADRSNSKEAAVEAGATDYLAKPFSIWDLLAHIESALKH